MKDLIQRLGYQFDKPRLLEMALTHRSMGAGNNERLEYLGDSILNFIIADTLFHQFPHAKEGDLSRWRANLVNENMLADLAQGFKLGEHLILGPGELKSGGARRKSILADALEAIIGAIYLDSNIQRCQECILKWFAGLLQQVDAKTILKDAKSCLQEYVQAHKLDLPNYSITAIKGEAHNQFFYVTCEIDGLKYRAEGEGTTRRAAEQMAAEDYLAWLKNKK